MKITNSLRLVALLIVFFALTVSVQAQDKTQDKGDVAASKQMSDQTIDEVDIQAVLAEIRSRRPEYSESSARADIALINNTQGEIASTLERARARDLLEVSLSAWKEVRLNSRLRPDQAMVRSSFVAFVTEDTGLMLFDSEPDQADVLIGADRLGTTSNQTGRGLQKTFLGGTTVTVIFHKPNFKDELQQCTAVARDAVQCNVALKPLP
jgi:hypothetical protein